MCQSAMTLRWRTILCTCGHHVGLLWLKPEAIDDGDILVNYQNESDNYIGINAISIHLDFDISQQDECFCSKYEMQNSIGKNKSITLF